MAGFIDTYETYRCGACQYITVDAEYVGEGVYGYRIYRYRVCRCEAYRFRTCRCRIYRYGVQGGKCGSSCRESPTAPAHFTPR